MPAFNASIFHSILSQKMSGKWQHKTCDMTSLTSGYVALLSNAFTNSPKPPL